MIKRSLLFVFAGAVLFLGVWSYGFCAFVRVVEAQPEPILDAGLESTDAIVALTGGSERLATGVKLLESGNGKKLFVSGVHKNLSIEGVLRSQPISSAMRACCVVLGYRAGSTNENANETRLWMNAEGYTSLRLVTANYHMPRSLYLFREAMPNIRIVPHAVAPDSVKLAEWWKHRGTISLLVTEYAKFLLAKATGGLGLRNTEIVEASTPNPVPPSLP